MTVHEIHKIEKELNLPHNKLKYFFKNLKFKDFKTFQNFTKDYGSYNIYTKNDKEILEKTFLENAKLSKETLIYL